MAWDAYHRRKQVLGEVMAAAERRRDGVVPWTEVPGVENAFGTPTEVVRALHMRWHTRLSGAVERALSEQPWGLEQAVVHAWRQAAAEMPGVRAILDAYADQEALRAARCKEWALLATASGAAGFDDPAAARVGRAVEERARQVVIDKAPPRRGRRTWISRLREAWAA